MKKKITLDDVKLIIRDVPDFPKQGILFKDITTMLKSPAHFNFLVELLYNHYKDAGLTKIVGIESRGFILGGALAHRLNIGFVPIRKPGKLPADKYSKSYELEYGIDAIEIHKDALSSDDVVLIHDDLLATGGTASAAIDLMKDFDIEKVFANFIIELTFLEGKKKIAEKADVFTLIQY